jgi:glycosyltransferase involved in cell wall biosynthesis
VNLIAGTHYGGTYQYNLNVVRALEPLVDAGWTMTAFVHDPAWRSIVRREVRITQHQARQLGVMAAALYRRFDRSPAGARRSSRLHGAARTIDAANCDIVVYPSQDEEAYLTAGPAVVAIHDLMHRYESSFREYGGREREVRDRHYRLLCARAAGILVDSELGRRQVAESYEVSPSRIHVLPFTPPSYLRSSSKIDVRAMYRVPERYLFYPAALWEHKNHLRLLEALAIARTRGVAANLVLCGAKKDAWPEVERRIAQLGLAANVQLLGYVPNEHMRSLYEAAVATVFVSLIGPTSIPPLEAMAVGSPLVIADVYAAREQVGDAAVLVEGRDPDAIARGIERVWTDDTLRTELAAHGRERAQQWTEADFGARLRDIVQRLAR